MEKTTITDQLEWLCKAKIKMQSLNKREPFINPLSLQVTDKDMNYIENIIDTFSVIKQYYCNAKSQQIVVTMDNETYKLFEEFKLFKNFTYGKQK